MYACMYVCMYVSMYVCMYIRMYVCKYVCYIYMYIYTHAHIHTYIHIAYLTCSTCLARPLGYSARRCFSLVSPLARFSLATSTQISILWHALV